MASTAGFPARHWSLAAMLGRWMSPRTPGTVAAVKGREPATRRYYPPQRDRTFEQAALAREMYRL